MPTHRKGPETPKLAAEYESGATSTDLATKYDMTHAAVIGRLRRAGVPIRPARRRALYDRAQLSAEIVSAYRHGVPMVEIAKQLSTSHGTVQRTIAAAGVETRPHGLRRSTVRVPSDPAAIGYLAGLLDGEGHLQVRRRNGSVACRMTIYSTTTGVIRWLLREVGGVARFDTKRTEQRGWLPIGVWSVYRARDVAALLRAMQPLLIVKKQRAAEILTECDRLGIHDSPPTITQSTRG